MTDWSNVMSYLMDCETHTKNEMEDPSNIRFIDEAVTASRNSLATSFGLDATNEREMYALVVGLCIAYRFPVIKAQDECSHPVCYQAFMTHHARGHGDIGLFVRSVIKDLGVEVAVPEAD